MRERREEWGGEGRPGRRGMVLVDLSFVDGLDLDGPREFHVLHEGWLRAHILVDWGEGVWCVPPAQERVWA